MCLEHAMNLKRKITNVFKIRPRALLFVGCLSIFAAAVVFTTTRFADSQSVVGLVAVLIGAAISAATSILLSRENSCLQMRTAALEKRLVKHQEAYTLWCKIVRNAHNCDSIGEVIHEAEEWWNKNCLYLDAASREAFRNCLLFAPNHKSLLEGRRSEEVEKRIRESWKEIMKPGKTLVEGVALPSLGKAETPSGIQDALERLKDLTW